MPSSSDMADVAAIRAIAARWAAAVGAADLDELARLMTEDIVFVHGSGRQLVGREAVLADFAASFRTLSVRQAIASDETIVAGAWAFDRARVHTTVVNRDGGPPSEFRSRTVTILRKQTGQAGWQVARVIGVLEQ